MREFEPIKVGPGLGQNRRSTVRACHVGQMQHMTVQRVLKLARDAAFDTRDFGPRVSYTGFRCALPSRVREHPRVRHTWQVARHNAIRDYLGRNYGAVADGYATAAPPTSPSASTIWTCWWQGEEAAPPIVRHCLESQRRFGGGQVVCISEANYRDYVTVPPALSAKVEAGDVGLAQLSDFIRYALLADYGGLWLDATVYLTDDIPGDVFTRPLFTCKREPDNPRFVSAYRWTSFAFGAWASHPMFTLSRELMSLYWADHDRLIDYLLVDYFIELAYERVPTCREHLDAIPRNNPSAEGIMARLNDPFDRNEWESLTSDTWMHKLTWKLPVAETSRGATTFYGHIAAGRT